MGFECKGIPRPKSLRIVLEQGDGMHLKPQK